MVKDIKISFEYFPPKNSELEDNLWKTTDLLKKYNPEYISVTYGAGGTTKEKTFDIVKTLKEDYKLDVAAHLTCVNSPKVEIDSVLEDYKNIGVNKIVALRGDPPNMQGKYIPHPDGYSYAVDLVKAITKKGGFDISVAAYPEKHPEASSLSKDIDNLKAKSDAGAKYAITQFCFDTDKVIKFRDLVDDYIKIVPGVIIINNFEQIKRFSKACGANIPNWLEKEFLNYKDGLEVDIAYEQIKKLKQNGFDEFHIYTLNRGDLTSKLCEKL